MRDKINILILGDIVGKLGRHTVQEVLPELVKKHNIDLTIGNVENLAHGKGITEKTLQEMSDVGIDVFTGGDHIWNKQDPSVPVNSGVLLALPANDDRTESEKPWVEITVNDTKMFVLNLIGRVFMADEHLTNPFHTFDKVYEDMGKPSHLIVDIHCEATSEKVALGYYADGKASLVYGTHTHIPTADERILEDGTGYLTDVGMTGSNNDVLGVDKNIIIDRFTEESKNTFQYPETGPAWLNAILCSLDTKTGKCTKITRLTETLDVK